MARLPQVSIVMPVYNAESYLAEAVQSILNQSFHEFELLIINDGSTDKSPEIIRDLSFRDSRIRVLNNKYQKGIVGALNTGLLEAKGRYIARADADDKSREYRLKAQYDFFEQNKDIYILGGGYAPFNERGHRIDILHPESSIEIAWKFISDSFFCHPTVMMRREIIDTIGRYPDIAAEDYGYFSEILKKFRGHNIQQILIEYREHTTNVSRTNSERMRLSVQATSEDNYRHYTGSLENYELFKMFQRGTAIPRKDLFRLAKLNSLVLNVIRKQYNLPLYHIDYIGMNLKCLFRCFKQCLFLRS